MRLDGADGDVLAVLGLVAAPEGRAAVEVVELALVDPFADGGEAEAGKREVGRALGHGDVDDLALAGALRFQEGGEQSGKQEHGAAAHVADDVQRRHRVRARADGVQDAGERDVVDVVAGGLGERAGLAPAGHAAVDEARVAIEADVGAEAEALHDAGAHRVDEGVRLLDQAQDSRDALGMLEVDGDGGAAAAAHVGLGAGELEAETGGARAIDADDVGAHVGEQRGAQRAGADAGDLHDLDAGQGAALRAGRAHAA